MTYSYISYVTRIPDELYPWISTNNDEGNDRVSTLAITQSNHRFFGLIIQAMDDEADWSISLGKGKCIILLMMMTVGLSEMLLLTQSVELSLK